MAALSPATREQSEWSGQPIDGKAACASFPRRFALMGWQPARRHGEWPQLATPQPQRD